MTSNEIDLIAGRRLARILPSQDLAVGKEQARSVPSQEIVGSPPQAFDEETFDFRAPPPPPPCLVVEDRCDERCLDDRVIGVKLDELVRLARLGKFMPLFVYPVAV